MSYLDDLIQFENENTSLEFKREQYLKDKFEDLLKDLMAMANANVVGDRHIIVGIKHLPGGSRKFWAIPQADFMDSATYHQLARENIEPEIRFEYKPYEHQGHLLGVFRIYDCNDQPYVMRKDYGLLKAGDAWIRKGTHQPRLTRPDLDRIWQRRNTEFTAAIRIGFEGSGTPKEITVPALGKISLPSDLAAEEIEQILSKREKNSSTQFKFDREAWEANLFRGIFGAPKYEHRSTQELKDNLEKVKDTYRDDDLYELYEVHGEKLNLEIVNDGESYVEDASIRIKIRKLDGLRLANRIYAKPDNSGRFGMPAVSLYMGRNYPSVKNYKDYLSVFNSIGTLRHGIPEPAFQEPLRIVFGRELLGQKVILECTLRGKQLRTPRTESLTIQVREPDEEVKK